MLSAIVFIGLAFFLSVSPSASAAEILPFPSMPYIQSEIVIWSSNGGLRAEVLSNYIFDYIPENVVYMTFPVFERSDSADIWVKQDGVLVSFDWIRALYPTILSELPGLPMMRWSGPFPVEGCIFTVHYEHDLIKRPDEEILLYPLGVDKIGFTPGNTTVDINVVMPDNCTVQGVWLDETAQSYETDSEDGIIRVSFAAIFENGENDKDFIVSIVETSSGEGDGGGGCFIATVVYGTEMAEEVVVLKKFRDECLLVNEIGQAFVRFYYRHSPLVAEYLRRHEVAGIFIRMGLRPMVWLAKVLTK